MDSNLISQIITYIERNRVSSVEVADVLNKSGVIEGVSTFNPGHFVVGKVHYAYTHNESNWSLQERLSEVNENTILYVEAFDCKERALFGDLVSKYLVLYKKVKGIVVNGNLRDAHRLRKENYPIWLKGVTPLGCFNNKVPMSNEMRDVIVQRKKMFENSIMVCDDSGCTNIQSKYIDQGLIKKLEFIELQEDIWYFCVDTLKLSTFETVCLKKYLEDKGILPESLRAKLINENL